MDFSARTNFILDEIPVPMVYATYRIIRDCNEQFLALFRYSRSELIDKSFAYLYPKKSDFVRTGTMWQVHLLEETVYRDERIMTTSEGHRFWCRVDGRTRSISDPFAQAVYCFQPISRPVALERIALTDRQQQIVALVTQGKTNAAIAGELGLSVRTIESHRARLMKAANIRNAAQLAAQFSKDSP
jgi:PAS domain S-box-containing protein